MNEQEVVSLMESSQNDREWNANCDKVKRACGGYPSFWWQTIIQSGLGDRVMAKWNGSTAIRAIPFRPE